jgi:hypothetical protein
MATSSPMRNYQDRSTSLARVRSAGVKVCCGGIVGMGETPPPACRLWWLNCQPHALPGIGAHQPGEN